MRPVRWGLIGTGEISRNFAADLTSATGSRRLAVASRSASRGAAFAAECAVERAYASVDALLDDPDVDVVHIGTPHGTHRALALRALGAGKPIVVEKPIGLNRAEVEEISDAAASAGLFAMEAMWMKFKPELPKGACTGAG
ncbi:Gfo/Idh/MocA family protein [Arthrobacter sp. W4I7]|uniref:Gfo/Idh/MocA family protein n=1 Tax=Arthrobacter sp. W4I7 TaxID=3042296 RepID=UPI0027852B20|nr:Gfo/Idh/MocA family oxidoreductase [Arthrobacter sp. W4I7]MDQ0691300.1 putative dehydrogenase [Arthrobacter sp. W4I7]